MSGTYLRVGLMLVASVALAVGLVLFLGKSRVTDGVSYETYFSETVQGLDIGSPVKFRGVQLGQVSEIALVAAAYPDSPGSVRDVFSRMVMVRFEVDRAKLGRFPSADDAITAGLRTRLAAQGITGLAYVELDFVDPERFPAIAMPWKADRPVIPSMPSTITQIQDAAQALAVRLKDIDIAELAASVQRLVNDGRRVLGSADLTQTLTEAAALLRALRAGAEAADVPGLVADLRQTVATFRNLADGPQSRELIVATTKAAERLGETVTRLPALIAGLEAAVRRVNNATTDAQSELLPALRDARAAAANLRDTSETLRRNPASILLGAPPPRPRQ